MFERTGHFIEPTFNISKHIRENHGSAEEKYHVLITFMCEIKQEIVAVFADAIKPSVLLFAIQHIL